METKLENNLKERLAAIAEEDLTLPELLLKAYQLDREWIPVIKGETFETDDNTMLLFDTGEICRYGENEWPRAIITHRFDLPPAPGKEVEGE